MDYSLNAWSGKVGTVGSHQAHGLLVKIVSNPPTTSFIIPRPHTPDLDPDFHGCLTGEVSLGNRSSAGDQWNIEYRMRGWETFFFSSIQILLT